MDIIKNINMDQWGIAITFVVVAFFVLLNMIVPFVIIQMSDEVKKIRKLLEEKKDSI